MIIKLSKNAQKCFDAFDSSLKNGNFDIVIQNEYLPNDVMTYFKFYLSQNPNLVFVDNSKIALSKGFKYSTLHVSPKKAKDVFNHKIRTFGLDDSVKLNSVAKKLLLNIRCPRKNQMQTVIAIFDYMISNIIYAETDNAHDAWGALVDGKAVCEGIAYAFCLLTQNCGIESTIVSGSLKGQPHAWNMVKIDDMNYHVDITSNLINGNEEAGKKYDYLFLQDSDMNCYVWNKDFYPVCHDYTHNYFIITDSYADTRSKIMDIMIRQITNGRIIYFRASKEIKLDEKFVADCFLECCNMKQLFYTTILTQINSSINTAYIKYYK